MCSRSLIESHHEERTFNWYPTAREKQTCKQPVTGGYVGYLDHHWKSSLSPNRQSEIGWKFLGCHLSGEKSNSAASIKKVFFVCINLRMQKKISTFGMDDIPCVLKPREAAKPKKSTPRNSQFFAPGQGLCSPSNQKTIRYYSQHLFSGANKNRVFNRGVFHPLLPFLKEIANLWTKCDNNRAQYSISLYNCMDITAWIYPLDFHSIETTLQRFVGNTAGPIQLNGCFRDPRILGCFLHGVIIIIR